MSPVYTLQQERGARAPNFEVRCVYIQYTQVIRSVRLGNCSCVA
jgi:hypothetical protein